MTLPALPSNIYSPDHLSELVLELGGLRSALQDASALIKTGSKKQIEPFELSPVLADWLDAAQVKANDMAALSDLHSQLKLLLSRSPVAHIMFATAPNASVKRQITEWFRQQISPYALLTFSARRDLCGGLVLQAGSHVYDFSFKRQLLENKQKIVEVAGRV